MAVTPRPELEPFGDLQYEGMTAYVFHTRPRGDLNPSVQYVAYSVELLCPLVSGTISRHRLPIGIWPELLAEQKNKSLRQLAKEYGVSYETVRRALASAKGALISQ